MIDRGGGASDEIDPDPDQACCRLFKKPIRRRRRIALFSFLHRVLSLPNSSPCSLITLPLLTGKAVLSVIRLSPIHQSSNRWLSSERILNPPPQPRPCQTPCCTYDESLMRKNCRYCQRWRDLSRIPSRRISSRQCELSFLQHLLAEALF